MQTFHLDSVDSTNDAAMRLLREGRITGRAYVLAREQTAGKGTRGRTWSSPRDAGIYLSVVDRPPDCEGRLDRFTRAAGVACAETLRECAGVEVGLKPINDLYVSGRKLGGILTEAVIERGRLAALVTGVGINLRRAERPTPDGAVEPVSLEEVLPGERFAGLSIETIVAELVRRILRWNALAVADDDAALLAAFEQYRVDDFRRKR